jgi:hypothetical protein
MVAPTGNGRDPAAPAAIHLHHLLCIAIIAAEEFQTTWTMRQGLHELNSTVPTLAPTGSA